MPMTMKVEGLDELSRKLNDMENRAGEVAARALYAGAGVMADAYKRAVNDIRAAPFRYAFGGHTRLPSLEEKAALAGAAGIAKFQGSATEIDTVVGISGAGYVEIAGRKKAVKLIANSINSGTSFMEKQPIYRRAVTNTRKAASEAMVKTADRVIEEITK